MRKAFPRCRFRGTERILSVKNNREAKSMFKKGTYKFNEDANFNFQLNRVVMWGNGDPDEIKTVAKGITDSASWVAALTKLADKAEKNGNTDAQIHTLVHYTMTELFLQTFISGLRHLDERFF